MTVRSPLATGDTFGCIVSWTYDRSRMRYVADHHDRDMVVSFHKVGGRWSRTMEDGTPSSIAGRSYWTSEVDNDRDATRHPTAATAKAAAVAEFVRQFGATS